MRKHEEAYKNPERIEWPFLRMFEHQEALEKLASTISFPDTIEQLRPVIEFLS